MRGEGPEGGAKRTPRAAVLDSRPEYERLGNWIRARREAAGLHQKPLSRQLGKPEQFLNKVENGRQRLDLVEFLDLCVAMGLDPGTPLAELIRAARGPTDI